MKKVSFIKGVRYDAMAVDCLPGEVINDHFTIAEYGEQYVFTCTESFTAEITVKILPFSMNKYEERVKRVSAELSVAVMGMVEFLSPTITAAAHMEYAARLVVKREADAFIEGYWQARTYASTEQYNHYLKILNEELEKNGLIPPQTEKT